MNEQHTPGPWNYERTHTQYGWLVLTADFDEDDRRGSVIARTSDGISESDAALLAAAPDLLAACEALVAHDNKGRFGLPNFADAISMARGAIAKAKGGG